jgi:hypothetical protein
MKALTIWQPWATLIIEGAKPYEFRNWRVPKFIIGERIAIHAGARPMKIAEIRALLIKLASDRWTETGLVRELATPILDRAKRWLESGDRPLFRQEAFSAIAGLPLSCIVGTAIVGEPTKNPIVDGHHLIADSDRGDHLNWAWPLIGIERWEPPMPASGKQGLWSCAYPPAPIGVHLRPVSLEREGRAILGGGMTAAERVFYGAPEPDPPLPDTLIRS